MGNWRAPAVLGMVIGVLIFVIGYSALEFTKTIQQKMADPVSRRAAWIAYGTRVAISILFIGVYLDIFCGAFAIGISSSVSGFQGSLGRISRGDVPASIECFQFMVTTIVQGVLLNLVLFAYMGIAWVVCNLISQHRS